MSRCAQCGNSYDKTFEITTDGKTLVFDSFECAIADLEKALSIYPGVLSENSIRPWILIVGQNHRI